MFIAEISGYVPSEIHTSQENLAKYFQMKKLPGIEIPIPFAENADLKDLKQPLYNVSLRDKKAINEVIDPFTKTGVIEHVPLGKPYLASVSVPST
jgi:hypothetical protein